MHTFMIAEPNQSSNFEIYTAAKYTQLLRLIQVEAKVGKFSVNFKISARTSLGKSGSLKSFRDLVKAPKKL